MLPEKGGGTFLSAVGGGKEKERGEELLCPVRGEKTEQNLIEITEIPHLLRGKRKEGVPQLLRGGEGGTFLL